MMVGMTEAGATEAGLDDQLGRIDRSFHRLGTAWKQAARAQAPAVHPELRPAAWMVFRTVIQSEPIAVADIIAETGMDKSVVSRQLKALREWELIEVERDEEDARVVVVRATEVGRERSRLVRAGIRERYRAALADWVPGEVATLAELLERLVPAVEDATRDGVRGGD